MKKRQILKVRIEGKSSYDLIIALDQVKMSIEAGNSAGFDSSDDGEYSYEIKNASE